MCCAEHHVKCHCRFVPLQRIGEKLLGEVDVQLWGECRGTLMGLLAAFNYETGILTAAARLLNGEFRLPNLK